jgi:hypothetical protein
MVRSSQVRKKNIIDIYLMNQKQKNYFENGFQSFKILSGKPVIYITIRPQHEELTYPFGSFYYNLIFEFFFSKIFVFIFEIKKGRNIFFSRENY